MKRIAQLLTLVLMLCASPTKAQMRAPQKVDLAWTQIGIEQSLEGAWRASAAPDAKGKIELQKCTTPHCWGRFFKFNPEGKMQTGYAVPCGNDPNYRFFQGTWNWDPDARELSTSANFDDALPTTFRIEKVTADKLVLTKVN